MSVASLTIPDDVLQDLAAEVLRARAKFPRNHNLNVALMEEIGEFAMAQLQDLGPNWIRREGIQAMAMIFRIISETDASLTIDAESTKK